MSKSEHESVLILFVEDVEDQAKPVIDLLYLAFPHGRVEWVKTADQAIDYLLTHTSTQNKNGKKRKDIDLVIIDLQIPFQQGRQAELAAGVKLIREYRIVLRKVPIIIFTNHDEYPNYVDCLKAGATDFIPKALPHVNANELLVQKCVEFLRPPPQERPLSSWLSQTWNVLLSEFEGRWIGVVTAEAGNKASLDEDKKWKLIGGRWVTASDSYETTRLTVLLDHAIRWSEPEILKIERE